MQEFLTYGYAATSMDRIAATAGVSKATIYSHFRDKTALFAAIVDNIAQYKFAHLFDPYDPDALQGPPRAVLGDIAAKMLDQAHQDTKFCEFIRLIVGESGRFPELGKPYIESIAKPVINALSQYLASRNELNLKDPEATARIIIGSMIYFIMLQDVLHGSELLPMHPQRLIDAVLDLIVPETFST
jgi:AcrR family transcriptional regulator